jgi:hypothetical protein
LQGSFIFEMCLRVELFLAVLAFFFQTRNRGGQA